MISNSSVFYTLYEFITSLYDVVVCDCSGSIVTKYAPGGGYGGSDSTEVCITVIVIIVELIGGDGYVRVIIFPSIGQYLLRLSRVEGGGGGHKG